MKRKEKVISCYNVWYNKQELENGRLKSYFLEGINFEELYRKYRGAGKIVKKLNQTFVEIVILPITVGFSYDLNGELVRVNSFKIHYSRKGYHIVPKFEKEE